MNESTKWRKMLQPLFTALALLIAAATAAINKGNSDNADARFAALEVTVQSIMEQRKLDNADMSAMREAVSVIRSDVAFIRGKMEGSAKR